MGSEPTRPVATAYSLKCVEQEFSDVRLQHPA
jgi:hypothetical protein